MQWAMIFLALGLLAGVLAFSGIVAGSVLMFMFLAAFVVMLLNGVLLLMGNRWRERGTST